MVQAPIVSGSTLLDRRESRRAFVGLAAGALVLRGGDAEAASARRKRRRRNRQDRTRALRLGQSGFAFLTGWGEKGSDTGQFKLPKGIAVDGDGNVYVADQFNARVQKFTNRGQFLQEWTRGGRITPVDIAIGPVDNLVYVLNQGNLSAPTVQKWQTDGTFVTEFGASGSGSGQFVQPFGVDLDPVGNVYVTDTGNSRIQKFTAAGAFVRTWGSRGAGPGQFFGPIGIAVDGNGNVYVVDQDNRRIQRFTSDGVFVSQWNAGDGDNRFKLPYGIAVDARGNVYVSDTNNHLVQQFDNSGRFLARIGLEGKDPGEFESPAGVAVDSAGNLYVTDADNANVQVFAPV